MSFWWLLYYAGLHEYFSPNKHDLILNNHHFTATIIPYHNGQEKQNKTNKQTRQKFAEYSVSIKCDIALVKSQNIAKIFIYSNSKFKLSC